MNNKGVGAIFCLISAILTSARYLAAAIFMSGVSSWSRDLFAAGLENVGPSLKVLSILSLAAGIVFLGYGMYQDVSEKGK